MPVGGTSQFAHRPRRVPLPSSPPGARKETVLSSTGVLIDLLGAAALLLWGLRLLKGGMTLAFGARLRHFLTSSTRNRWTAFGAGFGATLALQSSTAMAVMVSSFVAQGFVAPAMAQAVMLGANVGTSVVAYALSLETHWLVPVAILIGVLLSTRKERRIRGFGEIAMGIGLMLLSLRLMATATEPLRHSQALAAFFTLLGEAPVVAVLLSAALAAASASSLAAVLFIMSIAAVGGISPELCLLLVAGANLGGALPPVLAVASEGIAARRLAIGNLLVRGIGAFAFVLTARWITENLWLTADLAQLTIQAHVAFNVCLSLLFLPLVKPATRLLILALPDKRMGAERGPIHLDKALLPDPPSALAAAMRETLRVGDLVQKMLETSLTALKANDEALCHEVSQLDDQVDAAQEGIKLYLTSIDRSGMSDAAMRQVQQVVDYATNLEHIGDIVERSLSQLTMKKIHKHLEYSPEGMSEIEELFRDTIENVQLAQRVFINRDAQIARRLMASKVTIRLKERSSVARHMERLQNRRPDTIQTTSLHTDVLRDLKRINGHLMSVATPILEEAGMLRESRLKSD